MIKVTDKVKLRHITLDIYRGTLSMNKMVNKEDRDYAYQPPFLKLCLDIAMVFIRF